MKKIVLPLLVCSLFAHPALADDDKNFLDKNPGFLKKYLHCAEPDPKAGECIKELRKRSCGWLATLQADVHKQAELEVACYFLAGEFKGDGGEGDIELIATIQDLGCGHTDTQAMDLLRKYWGQGNEMRALLFFASEYMAAETACEKQEPREAPAPEEVKPEENKPAETKPDETQKESAAAPDEETAKEPAESQAQ